MWPDKFQPMLAERKTPDINKLRYPLLASPKLDGIRCLTNNGAFSRTLKPIPNNFVFAGVCSLPPGLDGELVTVDPATRREHDFSTISSGIMSRDGEPEWRLVVFDRWDMPGVPYAKRLSAANVATEFEPRVKFINSELCLGPGQLAAFEARCVEEGYEGAMTRDPHGPYKYGRTTMREETLLKIKRFEDDEAVVVRVNEEMANENEDVRDVFGRAKRSTSADGKVGKGTMGSLTCKWRGVEFDLGTGFSAAQRIAFGAPANVNHIVGRTVTFKFQGVGTQGRPRFPVFKGMRDAIDI